MAKLKRKDFKRPGGVLAIPRDMVRSPAYRDLPPVARCLLIELQDVWRPSRPTVHYSVRRAAKALGVSTDTAAAAFKRAEQLGFLRLANESDWINGQAREWTLTWMSANGREPADDWRHPETSTSDQKDAQIKKRQTRRTVPASIDEQLLEAQRRINEIRAEKTAATN